MKVIDAHCDLLSKMLADPTIDFGLSGAKTDVDYPRLRQGGAAMQWFAVYLSERLGKPAFGYVLEMIDLFYRKIAVHPHVAPVRTRVELEAALEHGQIGAMLTLEGVDGLEGSLTNLRIAYYLGVRCVGITWNYANWAADGVAEPRKGGFTLAGRQLVKECARLGILLDVSHLAEAGFWELLELNEGRPFLASHSNAYAVCPHRRNLTDAQIEAIVRIDGRIGVTFVPYFVSQDKPTIDDLLRHIDHMCALGAAGHIGFGSDFDGIEEWLPGLSHPGEYGNLTNALLKRYKQEQVEGFLYRNWLTFLQKYLPA